MNLKLNVNSAAMGFSYAFTRAVTANVREVRPSSRRFRISIEVSR